MTSGLETEHRILIFGRTKPLRPNARIQYNDTHRISFSNVNFHLRQSVFEDIHRGCSYFERMQGDVKELNSVFVPLSGVCTDYSVQVPN